jgi:hypothetical protein
MNDKKEKKNAKAMKENKHCGLQSHYRQVGKEKKCKQDLNLVCPHHKQAC